MGPAPHLDLPAGAGGSRGPAEPVAPSLPRRPELLLPFTVLPNIWGRILGRLARVPRIVGNCRGGEAPRRQGERWLWPLAHHIVCNSASLKGVLSRRCGVPLGRISVIPNGVDTDYFRPTPDGARPLANQQPVVLSVARMVPDKDLGTLIRAFALVAPDFPEARLWLVGEGPDLEALEQQAQQSCRGAPSGLSRPGGPQAAVPAGRVAGLEFPHRVTAQCSPGVAMAAGLPVAATAGGGGARDGDPGTDPRSAPRGTPGRRDP